MSETEQETTESPETTEPDTAPEPEEEVEEEAAEEEPEQPPEPEAILSEKQMERAISKLESEAARHRNRVSEIMGEDALSLVNCELCIPHIPGFRFDVAPPEEVVARVRRVIGLPELETLEQDRYSRRCASCDGAGYVKTDSRVLRQEKVECYDCKGRGWIPVGPERQTPQHAAPVANGGQALADELDDGVKRDMFGTPEGDPDYGLMPNMRSRPIEYWQTQQGAT